MNNVDAEILEIVRGMPAVQEVIKARQNERANEGKEERLRIIDELSSLPGEYRKIDGLIDAQKPIVEKANAIYQAEARKLGELTGKRDAMRNKESWLCNRLGCLGEGELSGAINRIIYLIQDADAQIGSLEFQLKHWKTNWHGQYEPGRDLAASRLPQLKVRRKELAELCEVANSWAMARISPREQADRIDALICSLASNP